MARSLSRRAFLSGLVAWAGTAALLSSCSSGKSEIPRNQGPASGTRSSPTLPATTGTPAVVSSTGSRVRVVYWGSFSGDLGKAEQAVVQRFNESQDDVELVYQYQGSYEETAQKLAQAVAARQTPDVVLLSDVWWFKFYLNGVIAPLDDFFQARQIDLADYVDPLINEGIRKGSVYWVPFARSTPLFYYNKEAWSEAGLPDRGPRTWDEFRQWVPELVRSDGGTTSRYAFAHPNAASYVAWLFQGVIWQFGGRYSDPDFTIRLAEPAGVQAGQFYRSTVADGWAVASQDLNADFVNGLTAAMMASTASLGGLSRSAPFEVGTAFLPEGPAGFGCCTGGSGLAILADKPREIQEAAFDYLAFATSTETTIFWSQSTGYMPVRKSAVESEEMKRFYEKNPNFRTAVEQLPKTRPQDAARVFIPNGDQIIGKGLERVTINQEEPQVVFAEVAQTLEDEAQPVLTQLAQRER